ncbi:MAG: tetratricopeptide repeat protein [Armatimonadota bacterium]|nr:tetratricopeptide repeat protein [Armatimonadota bacterium]MDT7971458.1 tetratricopeptide repeat protein [Armatimonadota bacterium]
MRWQSWAMAFLGFGFALTLLGAAPPPSWRAPFRHLKAWWFNQQGQQAFRQGNFRQALQSFRKAHQIIGDDAIVRYNEGTTLLQLRRPQDAEQAFQDALRRLPAHRRSEQAAAYYNLGNLYFARQQWDKAAQAYIAALKRTPNDLDAKFNLELVLRRQQQRQQPPPPKRQTPPPPLPPPPSLERNPLKQQLQRGLTAPWHGERDW